MFIVGAPFSVRIASTVSAILVPAEPSLPNSCLLRACVGTARFRHGCSFRPSHKRFVLFSYVRVFPYGRPFVRARVLSRARFSACARGFQRAYFAAYARAFRTRVVACARAFPRAFLLRARVLSRARFFLRARVFARAFSLRARAPSRARLLCACAYFTTRRAAAHTPSVRRGFLYSHSTSPTRTQAYVPLPLNCACLPSLVEKTPDGGFPSVPLKADARLLTSFFFV